LAEIGYQMLSKTSGRSDLFNKILMESPFNVAANRIRIDLAFAFAGAVYGAEYVGGAPGLRINVDQALKNIFAKAKVFKPWSLTMVEKYLGDPVKKFLAYLKWNRIISPDAAFRAVRSQA